MIEYFKWLINLKTQSSTIGKELADVEAATNVLQQLDLCLSSVFSQFDPNILRSVPWHEDLHAHNVLIDDTGHITGIIDWEYHMVKPAVLVAAYPSWISYSGIFNPHFTQKDGQFGSFWFASPAEAEQLRLKYDEVLMVFNSA